MRALMGLIKDRHGTYYAQKRVPDRLQEAVARALNSDRPRQVFLKKSLGTKTLKEANTRAKPVLMEFDRTLREAEALLKRPEQVAKHRTALNDAEIKRMAEYVCAKALAWDERVRFGRDEWKRIEAEHGRSEGAGPLPWATPYEQLPPHGLSPSLLENDRAQLSEDLKDMREALALGNITAVEDHIADALSAFGMEIDKKSAAYPKLGVAVLRAYVEALQAIERRNAGEPVSTPQLLSASAGSNSGTLREALEGWKKERERPEGTIHEYRRAIEMFVQLHGNLPIADVKRSHARSFREALQMVPKIRKGPLLTAPLTELSEHGKAHPKLQKVSAGTVNKQLGAVQAIAGWGFHNGLVPEDASWADPFREMRLEEEQSERAPFDARDLQTIFDAPLFTARKLPIGAKGDAGIWLPVLALLAGARQAEFAGLKVSNVSVEPETSAPLMYITSDRKARRRLKTKTSERVVPVHPQLIALGFLDYVAARRADDGEEAWLFPTVAPDKRGALKAWSKWWGRYLRTHVGLVDRNKVFHSFRHGFQDALRRTTPDEELRDALTGRSSGKSVSRTYGARRMLERWGVKVLKEAIDKISYPGLDLSRVRPLGDVRRTRGTKATKAKRPASRGKPK